jgi:hypothetical protein
VLCMSRRDLLRFPLDFVPMAGSRPSGLEPVCPGLSDSTAGPPSNWSGRPMLPSLWLWARSCGACGNANASTVASANNLMSSQPLIF